ncbi:hypothetical protein CsatB_012991 [Cannabis sativa]
MTDFSKLKMTGNKMCMWLWRGDMIASANNININSRGSGDVVVTKKNMMNNYSKGSSNNSRTFFIGVIFWFISFFTGTGFVKICITIQHELPIFMGMILPLGFSSVLLLIRIVEIKRIVNYYNSTHNNINRMGGIAHAELVFKNTYALLLVCSVWIAVEFTTNMFLNDPLFSTQISPSAPVHFSFAIIYIYLTFVFFYGGLTALELSYYSDDDDAAIGETLV